METKSSQKCSGENPPQLGHEKGDHEAEQKWQNGSHNGPFGAFCFADIDQIHRAIFPSLRQELRFLHDGVLREMARMAFGRVASPIHDEVGSLFYFAERTGNFTTQLGSDFGGTVSQRCVTVQQPPQLIR